jgi:hypothetical protein
MTVMIRIEDREVWAPPNRHGHRMEPKQGDVAVARPKPGQLLPQTPPSVYGVNTP